MSAPAPHPVNTGIFTLWFTSNYGAILTTFALYRLSEQEGLYPVLADQAPLAQYAKWCASQSLSRAFMQRHGLRCSSPLRNDTDIQQLNHELQTFIVGSDQVWRWQYTRPFGLMYFLDFVRGDKRKIAVSSSFGIDKEERPADSVRKAGYYLRSFDAVSVREKSGQELLSKYYGVEGAWILDPVFLCGTECYEELLKDTEVPQKPYLLSYVLEPDAAIRRHIETIAAQRGLDIINMVDAEGDFDTLSERFGGIGNIARGVSPEQWLANIQGCAYFVTDSFHGVCFALLYHRPFLCVAPPIRGLARFTSLLELTGLQRCLLAPDYTEEDWNAATAPIDWESVQAQLERAIHQGRAWLHRALTTPRREYTRGQAELVYELLYAGNGAKDRNLMLEVQVQQRLTHYRTRSLPRQLRLKKAVLRLLSYCPLPAFRSRCCSHLQALRKLSFYLSQNKG